MTIDLISLIIAVTALTATILRSIRHSKCFGVEIETRGTKGSLPESPTNYNNINESSALLTESKPIDITNKRKVVKNWL